MRFNISKSVTAALAALAMLGTMAFATATPAEAGWRGGHGYGHSRGYHRRAFHRGHRGFRHVGYRGYRGGFRGYRHVGYRHYGHRHYGHRHYGYRHYGYRHAYYPRHRHYGYGYGYRRYNPGAAIAASIIGGIAVGALGGGYGYPYYGY